MDVTSDQLRAARVLLRLEQAELAQRADVSIVTIRRIETLSGREKVSSTTFSGIQQALEKAGAEFIPDGVRRRRPTRLNADALYEDLRDISLRGLERLQTHALLMDTDLYDENGLPA